MCLLWIPLSPLSRLSRPPSSFQLENALPGVFSDPMLVPCRNINHKLWWETKLTTCCDCAVGKMRFRNMNQYHNAQVPEKNPGLSRQPRWLTDSSRTVPAVPQIVTFTTGLLDIHTNTTFPLRHTFDACNCLLSLLCKMQTGKWQLSPVLMRRCLSLCQSELNVCVYFASTCIFICVVGLAESLTNARGETRRLKVILSSLPSEYKDFEENEPGNEPQCCTLCGKGMRLIL